MSTRLIVPAVAAAVAVAAAIVLSSSSAAPQEAAPPTPKAASLIAGIPERDGVLGAADAPVTVTEFLDLQCPACAAAAATELPALIDDHVRTGQVKLRAEVLHFLGPDSVTAADFAAGAKEQDRLWAFVLSFYAAQGAENSGYVTEAFLRSVADAAGVDPARATAYDASAELDRATAAAERLGVSGTPTFAVQRGDGRVRVVDAAGLERALAR
jgi:protein-disulfide isomerase